MAFREPPLTNYSDDLNRFRVINVWEHTIPGTDYISLNSGALTISGNLIVTPIVGNEIRVQSGNIINKYNVTSVTKGSGTSFTGTVVYIGNFDSNVYGIPAESETNKGWLQPTYDDIHKKDEAYDDED